MFKIEFDARQLSRKLSDVEKRQLPFALAGALNDTAFQTREAWKEIMPRVFDRPTALTLNAVLYKKATKQNALTAEIFIRDEAHKGTPPVRYLSPEEHGGARRQKPFERALARFNPHARGFYVPGRGIQLNQFGNVPAGVIKKIMSQLQSAESVAGVTANETAVSRARRLKRQRKRGGGGSYFILAERRGKLRAGVIFERIESAFGTAVRSVLFPVNRAPTYQPRFGAIATARRLAAQRFPANFAKRLRQAVATER